MHSNSEMCYKYISKYVIKEKEGDVRSFVNDRLSVEFTKTSAATIIALDSLDSLNMYMHTKSIRCFSAGPLFF